MKHYYYIAACISMCQLAVIAFPESPDQARKNTVHDAFCFESYLKPLNQKREELKKLKELQESKSNISKWFNKYKIERIEKQIATLKQALKDEGCRIMIEDNVEDGG